MTATLAMFLNAYRELNSKKLFWVVLAMSGLVVMSFAFLGINEEGISILAWTIPMPINTTMLTPETFYKSLFSGLGIDIWLTWGATILALVSTAGLFPSMISSGSISLILAKPITRLHVFITKYLSGMLFVLLQVVVFCMASFLILGFRGGAWEPGVFIAVPIVLIFFSYLYAICVFFGILTRSTIAALLWTILIWFIFLVGMHQLETWTLAGRLQGEMTIEAIERDMEARQGTIVESERNIIDAEPEIREDIDERLSRLREDQDGREQELERATAKEQRWKKIHRVAYGLQTVLPKTSETVGLMERALIELTDVPPLDEMDTDMPPFARPARGEISVSQAQVMQRLIEVTRERSALWIIGTSLLAEVFILAIAAWMFCRRDF